MKYWVGGIKALQLAFKNTNLRNIVELWLYDIFTELNWIQNTSVFWVIALIEFNVQKFYLE